MDTDIIARGMAGAAKKSGVVTKEKVVGALGYAPTYVDDESNGSSESTYSSEKIIKKISEVESWTGTKTEWEALDKSTLVDGQQINITDDGETVLTNADVEKFTADLNVAVEKAETAATSAEQSKTAAQAVVESIPADYSKLSNDVNGLNEDIGDLATFGKNQYIDSKTAKENTLWRNLSGGITRADGFSGFSTFPMTNLKKGTYYISKKIWHKYTWVKNSNGKIVALNVIDGVDGDTYSGVVTFTENVELYITIKTANLPLMVVDGDVAPPYYIDFGSYGRAINGDYKVDNYTLSEIEKSAVKDCTKIDYHFVKNGKLVCNNSKPTSAGAVAKYTKADMGSNIVKAMCVFSARNGGNVTLISTPLDTDNNVQNIVNKSIHCIFGMSSCVAQTFSNGTAKTLGTITYPTLNNDDTTEYECGFEIINDNTLRLYAPSGETHDCTGDWSEYNGKFFIYEEYNGKVNDAEITSEWERPSIIAVYCKPTIGHCLRDEFKNYPSGYIPCVAPSGHVYTNFRNVNVDDDKYINANGTHDNQLNRAITTRNLG